MTIWLPNSLCRLGDLVGAMERRSLLKRMGVVSVVGGLAGCSGGSGEDTNNTPSESTETPSESTEASFSGNWGVPACSDNEDARVVIQSYSPEQGVGQIYNRTNTNLLVSIMNEAGSTASGNRSDYDIYVPFGETNPFRLGGQISSVVTMTESKYRSSDSVDWLYRHETQENQGCTLPEGEDPTPVEIEPTEGDVEEDRIKDNVRDSTNDSEEQTTSVTKTTVESANIKEAIALDNGFRVSFSIKPSEVPSYVEYKVEITDFIDVVGSKSGRIEMSQHVKTSSKSVDITVADVDTDLAYLAKLYINGEKKTEEYTS